MNSSLADMSKRCTLVSQHHGKSRKVREKFVFLEIGNLIHFLVFRENQRIIFFISTEWSGKVREFVMIQVKHFVSKIICVLQIKFFLNFSSLRSARHLSFPDF